MLKDHPSIEMLDNAAKGFASIPGVDAVFVCGATTCLYIEDESIGRVRNTVEGFYVFIFGSYREQ